MYSHFLSHSNTSPLTQNRMKKNSSLKIYANNFCPQELKQPKMKNQSWSSEISFSFTSTTRKLINNQVIKYNFLRIELLDWELFATNRLRNFTFLTF